LWRLGQGLGLGLALTAKRLPAQAKGRQQENSAKDASGHTQSKPQ
jgi:hypothetical protein